MRGSKEHILPINVEGFLSAQGEGHECLIPERAEGVEVGEALLEGLVG